MTKPKRKRLADAEKAFVVKELACFGSPKEVSEALMGAYGVQLAPQNIECYDPNKRAGQNLGQKWRDLFEHTRKAFLDHVETHIPEAHKSVRIMKFARASRSFEKSRNYLAMAQMLERIAKDSERDHWPIMEVLTANVRDKKGGVAILQHPLICNTP